MNEQNFIIDIETLDFSPNAVILAIGVLPFYGEMNDGFFVKLNVADQYKNFNRTINKETCQWWEKQNEFVKNAIFNKSNDDDYFKEGLIFFAEKINEFDKYKSKFWSFNPVFTFSTLLNAFNSINYHFPINITKFRDIRTLMDILIPEDTDNKIKEKTSEIVSKYKLQQHHPVHDCFLYSKMIQEFLQ